MLDLPIILEEYYEYELFPRPNRITEYKFLKNRGFKNSKYSDKLLIPKKYFAKVVKKLYPYGGECGGDASGTIYELYQNNKLIAKYHTYSGYSTLEWF